MRKFHLLTMAFGAFVFLNAGPVRAEPSARDLIEIIDKEDDVSALGEAILLGLESAYSWSNATLGNRGGKLLYCQPENLAITRSQLKDIFERFVEEHNELADEPAGLVLLLALEETFPCS